MTEKQLLRLEGTLRKTALKMMQERPLRFLSIVEETLHSKDDCIYSVTARKVEEAREYLFRQIDLRIRTRMQRETAIVEWDRCKVKVTD